MELNEMEKKLLFQVEGDYQTKILNELYMTVRYSNNSEQREAAEGLMAKLRVLSNAECMDLVKDIQKNYRLPYPARTIGEKIAEARQQSGAEKLKGHDIMALERFDPEVKHMIVFDVLSYDSPVGDKGDKMRLFLTDAGYQKLMSNHHLRNTELSLKAKGLLSLMLSLPEDWDYTTKGLAHICKDGVDSITTALKELERHGYLTRQRLRYDNGQLGDIEYTIHEQPVSTENTGLSPKRENPRQVKPEQAKPKQAEPEQENPAQLNTNPLKTKKSKKDKSITYPSIYPAEPEAANRTDGMDRIELIEAYREIIKENIEYDLLVLRYGRERLDEALELMLEVILSKRPYIRIAGDDFPREIVKSRFLKINSGHLEYVFDCIDKNTTKVGNIKAYLLAALYNAPATMDSYYRAEVNHDLYGC